MMDHASQIRNSIDRFQKTVTELGKGISSVGALWQDQTYAELSRSISKIATDSKDIISASDTLCASLTRFSKIAQDEF